MDCPRIKEMLSGYLDGALGPADNKVVEEHLASCAQCSVQLEDLRRTIAGLRGLDDVDPPAWFTQRVMARIREERPRGSLLRRLFFPLHVKVPLQTAATVLIAVATIYIFRTMQHGAAPDGDLRQGSETAIMEKKEKPGEPQTSPAGPTAGTEAPATRESIPPVVTPAPHRRKAVPSPTETTADQAPQITYAPAQPPAAVGGDSREQRTPAAAGAQARRDDDSLQEKKASKAEPGRAEPQASGRLGQTERTHREHAPAAAATLRKKDERVIWSDETITSDDIAKVTRVVLVHENKDELVLDVSYYLSPDFDGYATVGVFPDIPDWSVAEARAMKGRHTISVPVSRIPSAEPGESTTLRIEIAGYRNDSFMGPLYRRIVPFGKRWESR